ncbi:copper chaperone PCu(A)C [Stutzerimonas urumqiensis]|uniref:copper chaperone PCu(A)C n=1 Tax=Stutzerimonas urumqiensis TaxID=638269 RepID=UPI000EB3D388|nr:copper chaperone PCu(A)C [Stutzerimonas urumqiensis]
MRMQLLALGLAGAMIAPVTFADHAGHTGAHHAVASGEAVSIKDAWAREMPPGSPATAAYLGIHNGTDQPRRLIGVSSTVAEKAELHTSRREGDMVRMERLEAIEIPANGGVELAPGGHHVMLMGLERPLAAGDTFSLTLEFADGETRAVDVEVRGQAPGDAHGAHADH